MTPKEKAEELVNSFDESLNHIRGGSNGLEEALRERAISCAIICVEEIILAENKIIANDKFMAVGSPILEPPQRIVFAKPSEYWQQVKQEIELL